MTAIQSQRIGIPVLCGVAMLVAASAAAAPPTVPASLPYQGLLLDGLGEPRTGSVDLTVRIYDAVVGGTLVYKQSFPSVALSDGVFNVQLGPSGEGSDAPSNPLTTDLATALGGDAGATSPVRFLQLTVGGDGPIARTQILSSAYAVRASSAALADTATTAQTAQEVANVGGVGATFVAQLFQYFNADGAEPPNDDPREGLGDTDGDGRANFIDSDNDNDTVLDATELSQASNINLVSPRVTSVAPNKLFFTSSSTVEVRGTGFQPGLAVVFGSQSPTPTHVTSTSFNVPVGPQPSGLVNVTVTNANGEVHTGVGRFEFTNLLTHSVDMGANRTTLVVRTNTVEAVLGGNQQYAVGVAAEAEFPLVSSGSVGQIGMAFAPSGAVAGLRCLANGANCDLQILVDSDGDNTVTDETPILVEAITGGSSPTLMAADLATDPAGRWVAGYVKRNFGPIASVAHDRNGDGDFADANEVVNIDSGTGNLGVMPADLAIDSAGRVAYVYHRAIGNAIRVAHDRNGDGDYADTVSGNPEFMMLASVTPSCLGATMDAQDHLAVIYGDAGGTGATLARDRNGDGDFLDTDELVAIVSGAATTACDIARRAGQPLTVMLNSGTAALRLLVDKNDDGDFVDTGEEQLLGTNGGAEAALALNGVNRALVATQTTLVLGVTD